MSLWPYICFLLFFNWLLESDCNPKVNGFSYQTKHRGCWWLLPPGHCVDKGCYNTCFVLGHPILIHLVPLYMCFLHQKSCPTVWQFPTKWCLWSGETNYRIVVLPLYLHLMTSKYAYLLYKSTWTGDKRDQEWTQDFKGGGVGEGYHGSVRISASTLYLQNSKIKTNWRWKWTFTCIYLL